MPRIARQHFSFQYYHVFNRGFDKKLIFIDQSDYFHFLDKLTILNKQFDWIIYGYCLMPNHYHLHIQIQNDPLPQVIHALQTSHAVYFNKKYKRTSSVFTSRFKSILIQKDSYHLALNKYIHTNPVHAHLVTAPEKYLYSSYAEIINQPLHPYTIIDKRSIRSLFNPNNPADVQQYRYFIEENSNNLYQPELAVRNILGSQRFRSQFESQTRFIS